VILSIIFNQKSLVEINPIDSIHENNDESPNKILFNLIQDEKISNKEKIEYKRLKRSLKQQVGVLQRLNFIQEIKLLNDYESCKNYLEEHNLSVLLSNLDITYKAYNFLSEKDLKVKTRHLIQKKLPSFRRKGWKIFSDLNMNEVHTIIKENPLSSIVLVGHATPNGELVDVNNAPIPSSFFRNLQIGNLLIYSCHPSEIINNYSLDSNQSITNYFSPQLNQRFTQFLNTDKIPMNSIKTIHNLSFKTVNTEIRNDECTFETSSQNNNIGVFLNKIYLGKLDYSISLDCNILKERSNLIEIYQTSKKIQINSLNLTNLTLNNSINIELSEFISRTTNTHIVSKGTFKLKGENYEKDN
jgi:hypothetical protein